MAGRVQLVVAHALPLLLSRSSTSTVYDSMVHVARRAKNFWLCSFVAIVAARCIPPRAPGARAPPLPPLVSSRSSCCCLSSTLHPRPPRAPRAARWWSAVRVAGAQTTTETAGRSTRRRPSRCSCQATRSPRRSLGRGCSRRATGRCDSGGRSVRSARVVERRRRSRSDNNGTACRRVGARRVLADP